MSFQFPDPKMTDAIRQLTEAMEQAKRRGWSFTAYNEAVELLKAMELRLSTEKRFPLKRFILVPFYLLGRGLEQMAISYGRGYIAAIFAGIAGLFLSQLAPADIRPTAETATILLNLFVAFTLVFAAPSTYCSAGTNMKHVSTVTGRLAEWKVESVARVHLVLTEEAV